MRVRTSPLHRIPSFRFSSHEVRRASSRLSPRVTAAAETIFRDVLVYDGSVNPPYGGEVLVRGNRIAAVANLDRGDAALSCDDSATVINGKGHTLMPGLVEGHAHASFFNTLQIDIPVEEHMMITMLNAQLLLDQGFTSLFSAGSCKLRLDVALRNFINQGKVVGPRLMACSPEMSPVGRGNTGGAVGVAASSGSFGYTADGVEEVRRATRMLITTGCDNIKINVSGEDYTNEWKEDIFQTYGYDEVAVCVEEAHRFGKRVLAHCRGIESVRVAARAGCDVLYHLDYADEEGLSLVAELAASASQPGSDAPCGCIVFGPTLGFLAKGGVNYESGLPDPKTQFCADVTRELKRREIPGLRFVIGGDYGTPCAHQGLNAYDIEMLVKLSGFTPLEALEASTSVAECLMNVDVGRVENGYVADLLLVKGSPTTDVTALQDRDNLALIMLDGWQYKNIL